ncbi:phosphoglycerate mutase [Luteimonas sp. MC1750]|uniref:phosphoglycerate mutase n=1 Tax=Luteimonas sp. MC1750 TaxID=2799326 RepID=UPI0018F06383|nr:phosphoglycerate mutase [Luteimonas sp. MC1750]MBJ6984631.1 phosphoglycerate mutase [Luteimonas sp. MC1750]QQO04767.1 phosphoglycerate mutase [Luteimonas sp. MC1750]
MPDLDSSVILLLPAAARLGRQRLSATSARRLGRGGDLPAGEAGRRAQLLRHFPLRGEDWPIAALSRQAEAGDAEGASWLRADPVWLRPDINGVRLLAHGDALGLTRADCDALLPALRPLFGDAGFILDAPDPARWYLRLPAEARLPVFSDPGDALGEDIFEHLDISPEARRWRTLASEAQVTLHNHPLNARRAARGQSPVNALWFWGGGRLPAATVAHGLTGYSSDDTARALAAAGGRAAGLPERFEAAPGVYDLEGTRDLAWIEREWLVPALEALRAGRIATLGLDDGDGWRWELRRRQALRVWRRPLAWPAT